MSREVENVHFHDVEFLYTSPVDGVSWHYPPGWYFFDEEGDLYGPFLDKGHAERGLRLYLEQLMAGVSPTQLKHIPVLKKN